ncbi:MAG: glycosyltransferase, partial [Clostridiales bacterium]|nr:glycosyltransferase [Clostridiales bacterium]
PVEHIFSFQYPEDPAIPVVRNFIRRYPAIESQIIVNPVIPGLNGKSSNMVNAMKISKYDMVLFGDSDVRLKPDFICKMIRPLKDEKVGVTTCGQINMGGSDFWTRFFTFLQNNETIFFWAFFTKLGLDFGVTGAAFGMRKKLLQDIGGLEAFGSSLLEDLHLGNYLYKKGYKLILGPFIECHVDVLGKEKAFNYAKRIGIGLKTHLAVELPAFIVLLGWYWILLILGCIFTDAATISLALFCMAIRCVHAIFMRKVTRNNLYPMDIIMGLFFDVFGVFYLLYSLKSPFVSWRGIRYEVKKGGFIEDAENEDEIAEEG